MKTTLEKIKKSENYFRRLAEDDSVSYGESENYREHANGIAEAIAYMTLLRDREANTMKLAEHIEALGLAKERLEQDNASLRENLTLHRYSHDEIEAACGGEVALVVRKDVMKRRAAIISDRAHD